MIVSMKRLSLVALKSDQDAILNALQKAGTVEIIRLIERGNIRPGAMVSHILGLNAVPGAIFAMEKPSGAKKVCYTGLDIPLTAISDFGELGKTDPLYRELDAIVRHNGGLWCAEAERYLLAHAPKI